jgi:CubicO group peptidase (beta-lactamase class C family)
MGAYGQRLYVFPDHEMVVVMFGSHPQPIAAMIDPAHRSAFTALITMLGAGSTR